MNCVLAKANRMLGLIKRTCKGLNDLKTQSKDPRLFFSKV